jgi:xanthine dehydrogenase YagS FAD-binding subunit
MQQFDLLTPTGIAEAVELGAASDAMYLAGGTNLVDFLRSGAMSAPKVVDIDALPLRGIGFDGEWLRIGALARMSEVAADPAVRESCQFIAQSLELSASAQLRNMASIGGNLLQRTRCPYFRNAGFRCNKRQPGSGCAALEGENRRHVVLGGSDSCVATHPSDLAVALVAAGANVHLQGRSGERTESLEAFYREPGATPQAETSIGNGELIVAVSVPPVPGGSRSVYLKLRERASYEFALVSVAASAELEDGVITESRVALGGVATRPWRAHETETMLRGTALADTAAVREAAAAAFADARPLRDNAFKIELSTRAIVSALQAGGGV